MSADKPTRGSKASWQRPPVRNATSGRYACEFLRFIGLCYGSTPRLLCRWSGLSDPGQPHCKGLCLPLLGSHAQATPFRHSVAKARKQRTRVKRDFVRVREHVPPVLVVPRSRSRLRQEGRTRTLSGPSPDLNSVYVAGQSLLPASRQRRRHSTEPVMLPCLHGCINGIPLSNLPLA